VTTVRLELVPDAALVRLARLVAVSVARLNGLHEDTVEDIRLAVGEACGRAVAVHLRHGVAKTIQLSFTDGPGLTASIVDRVRQPPASGSEAVRLLRAGPGRPPGAGDVLGPDGAPAVLALLEGLADRLDISTGAAGTCVEMRWDADD
jgi:anti-sigma regulatory factor (Ser/Thr protein kinase)